VKTQYKIAGIEIRRSIGRGRGVFATKSFKKDEIIEISPIVCFDGGDADLISCTKLGRYIFSLDANCSAMALGYASLYNHSAQMFNCEWALNSKVIVITATIPIKKGEELLFNYGWDNETLIDAGIKPDQIEGD